MAANALDRHLALVGFMGAGKSTLGPLLAERLGRPFVSVDAVVEERTGASVAEVFERTARPRSASRRRRLPPTSSPACRSAVVELGGGALGSATTRSALAAHAFTLHLEVTVDEAWRRVEGSGRPLARDVEAFRALYEERRPLYGTADAARDRPRRRRARGGGRPVRAASRARGHGRRRRRARRRAPRDRRAADRATRRGGQDRRGGRAALAWAHARSLGDTRRGRRRLDHRPRRLRRGDVPARDRLDRGAVDARRPGRRGDRRQGGDRPAGGEEPRRRVPLARAHRHRHDAARRRCPRRSGATASPRS